MSVSEFRLRAAATRWPTALPLASFLAFLLGVVYVWRMPPGLPYDEPSHWATVLFYAHHARMPVLGQAGVTYEAQMGPVSYVLDALVDRATRALGASPGVAFHVVRTVGVLCFTGCVALVGSLLGRLTGVWAGIAASLGVLALNPMLLAMAGSVQNDALALLLGLFVLELSLRWLGDEPNIGAALAVGAVAGVAVLTKVSAWAAPVAVVIWLFWRYGRPALRPALALVGGAAAVCGWWIVRNVVLYGDPTGAAGVRRAGVSFSAYHVQGIRGVTHIVEELVTYLWLPTEYVRNTISAPAALKAALVVGTAVIIVLGARGLRRNMSSGGVLLLTCAALSLGSWLVTDVAFQAVAPRVAYLGLPVWVWLVCRAFSRAGRPRVLVPAAILAMILLNAWVLNEVAQVHFAPLIRL